MKALIVIEIPEIDFESCRANVEIDVGMKKIFRSHRKIVKMPPYTEEQRDNQGSWDMWCFELGEALTEILEAK